MSDVRNHAHLVLSALVEKAGDELPVERFAVRTGDAAFSGAPLVACVPAKDEEGHIERCLTALDAELWQGDAVLLVANACSDRTVALAHAILREWTRPFVLVECDWKQGLGIAPRARRLALDLAQALAPDAILLSVDADTIVLPGLRAAYEAEFAAGADLVCGRIGFIAQEAAKLPPADPDAQALIREYRETSRHLAAIVSPDPHNPWPHHGNIGGANFALLASAYRRVGPMPTPPSGEDRALRRRCEGFGLRIRYSDGPRVDTSCRLDGRAAGGLADELRRDRLEADPVVDELLEPSDRLLLRLETRAAFLIAPDQEARAAILADLGLRGEKALHLSSMGGALAWHEAEDASPVLRRTRLCVSDLRHCLPDLRRVLAAALEKQAQPARRTD